MSNIRTDEIDDETKSHPPNEAYEISDTESIKGNDKNFSEPNLDIKNNIMENNLNTNFNNNQIEKMKQKITQQATRLQKIEKNYQKIISENSQLKKRINEYENDLITLNEINNQLKEKKELNINNNNIENNLNNNNMNNSDLNNSDLNLKYTELLKEKSEIEKDNIEKEKKLNFYINEYSKIMDLNTAMTKDKTGLLKELHEQKLEISRKNNEVEEMKSLLNQNILDFEKEKKEILDNAYEIAKNQFIKKQEDLIIRLKKMEEELSFTTELNIKNEKELIKKDVYINDLENKNNKYKGNLKLNEEICDEKEKELKLKFNELKNKYDELIEENDLLKSENNTLKENYNSVIETTKHNDKEYLTLYENYNNLKKENEKINKFLHKIDLEKSKMEIANKSLIDENGFIKHKLNSDYEKLNNEIKLLREINGNLENQKEKLCIELNTLNSQNKNLINEKDTSIKNKINYEIDLKESKEKEKEYLHKINEIQYQLEDMEKEKYSKDSEINNLKNKVIYLQNENNQLKEQRENFITTINKLERNNKDSFNKYSYLSVKVDNAKSKIKLIPYFKNMSEEFLIYISQTKKINPEDNIEYFINYLLNEFQFLCKKIENLNDEIFELNKTINENKEKESNLNYIIDNLNKEIEVLNENKTNLEQKITKIQNEYNKIDNSTLDKMNEINDLKLRLNEIINQLKSFKIKNNHLQELINYYQTNKNNVEELIIQMSNYMRNIIVKQLIKDLIKNNYDLIELAKEISLKDNDIETENIHKLDIDNKLKEIFSINEKLKKELQLEERLFKIHSNFPYNPCITKTMNDDLEESKNNLKNSFSYYSSNLNK